jgi:autotransporter-associated beta strand protein
VRHLLIQLSEAIFDDTAGAVSSGINPQKSMFTYPLPFTGSTCLWWLASLSLLTLIVCLPHNAQAVTKTWDAGSTTGAWQLGNNWFANGVPVSGDDVLFDNSVQATLEDIFLGAAQSINSMTINLTVGTNQNWNLGSHDGASAFTLTLATGNISVLSTSGTGTYVVGATTGPIIGTGITTLATTATGFTFGNSRTNGGLLQISAIVSGTNTTVTKTGLGTVSLTGGNTYTGATTVSAGTLLLATSSGSALGSTTAIFVNTGGTLQLGASDQINNSATISLGGGTFAKGNFNEGTAGSGGTSTLGLGALTLAAAGSIIDFGTGTVGALSFASLNAATFTLTINNWTGTPNTVGNAGTDRLVFDSDQASHLSSFSFTGYGPGAVQFALGNGFFEVDPVPEPATWCTAALTAAALVFQSRHRMRGASLNFIRRLTSGSLAIAESIKARRFT